MKNVEPLSALRRLLPAPAAALLAMSIAVTGPAGATDISQTPILASSPAEVKPNIMLLMDASSSMGRTHMPDEVEALVTSPPSIGYKSAQCNALYFNPLQTYTVPKRYTDLPFTTPSFDDAPYAGFGEFYATPDLRRVNLNNAFVAYDNTTLEVQPAVYLDPPQAAYYYVYTNSSGVRPDKLDYTSALCRQQDNRRTDPTPDGGTWTRYDVSVGTTAEKEKFAIWYSFYRTRLALLKSAASLTFAPLNNTKRVGFITVQPKQTPNSPGIWRIGSTNEWPRYLPIGDFESGAGLQKELWFKKVFSQIPGGASPAREGLARVGRYYGSKEDQINTDMPATGLAAPIRYSCQQNFTIMTTDGYWNGQTETPGPLGGGLNLAGDAKVGQQDGNAADPYSPRPFWDGNADSIRTTVNKTNAYTDSACSVAERYRTQYQSQRQVDSLKRDSTVTTKTTVQYYESKSQAQKASFQIMRQEKYDFKTTEQFAKHKVWYTEESYKHIKWQEHTLMTNEQYSQRTRQNTVQTFQTVQVDKKSPKTEVQWKTSKSQWVETTTQYAMQTDQYMLGIKQVYMTQFRTLAHQGDDENGTATEGECVEINGIRCETKITFARKLVDPNTCTTGPTATVVGGGFLKQTCEDGPFARAYTPTNFCRVGVDPATDTNQWVQTRCEYVTGTPVPQSGPCNETDPPFQGNGPEYYVFTCKRPPANNKSVGVPACGTYTVPTSAPWITTTCGLTGPNNYPLRPSPECAEGSSLPDSEFVTTTCTKTILFDDFAPSCVPNDGSLDPFVRVTCGTEQTFNTPVPKGSCIPGIYGAAARTCPRDPVGPATAVPGACTDIADDLSTNHYETFCNRRDETAFVLPGNCRDQVASDPDWTTLNCNRDAPPPTYVDPRECIPDDGLVYPYLHTICATTRTFPRTPVAPSACPLSGPFYGPAAGNDFIVTYCEKQTVNPPGDVPRCTPNNGETDPFIVTTCGEHGADEEVHDCIVGPLPDEDGKQVTCVKPSGANNAQHVKVPVCLAQEPEAGNHYVRVTCEGQTIDPATVSNSADCPVGDNSERSFDGPDSTTITCKSTSYGPYAIPAWVAPCDDGRSRDTLTQVETVCSHPDPNNNYVDRAAAPCPEVVDAVGPNEVRTTCRKSTVGPVQVATWQCPASVAQTGTGPDITCDTHTNSNEFVTSCTENAVNPFPPYETTTRCDRTPIETMRDYPGECIEGPGTNPGEVITCGRRLIDGSRQLDASCVGPDTVNPEGIITHCEAPIPSGGHKYFVSTTTTITTQTFSGGVPTSNPAGDPPTPTPPVPVDDVCYSTPHDFNAIQPVPPTPPVGTTCASGPKYPCYTVTATTGGSVNSLADVSQYYYKTDLRPDMTDDPEHGGVPPGGTGLEDDKAPHQHMTTFVVGIGVSGTLNYQPDYRTAATGDYADIRNGPTKNWPIWPDPDLDKPLVPCGPPRPNTYQCNESLYNDPRSIDDFWHTAVNGRGRFFSASDPTTVIEGLGDALAQIEAKLASGTAEAVSTLQPTTTPPNNSAYSTTYTSGVWEGDIQARTINVSDGTLTDRVWSAKEKIGPRQGLACDDREIYLMRGGNALTNFTTNTYRCTSGSPVLLPDGLNGAEIAQLVGSSDYDNLHRLTQWTLMTSAQQTAAKDVGRLVNFIRGQRANEGFKIGSLDKIYRRRGNGVLFEGYIGDIVNSQPVYVGQPFANYQENNYTDFKGHAREPMLYVGANDGMLHAFYATTDTTVAHHGQEAWAIIPSAVLGNLVKLADDGYKRAEHQFYVDGTPVAGDVWNGSEWRTILVGGLNAGGRGYYALDVTSPGALPTPLWEFKLDLAQCPSPAPALMPTGKTGDCNVGMTFGKPIITKLGTEWVVMVTSGYNNSNGATGDGFGYLYVINAMDGKLKYKISTGQGSFTEPSGLAQINNYVDNVDVDNRTLRAYGGDVLGNIFRFEFPPLATEASATLIGIARDPDNRERQPITVRPELAELDGKPFVIVGTGRLLGGDDVDPLKPEALQRQSVYGLRDTLGAGPVFPEPMRPELRPMRVFQSTGTPSASTRREIRCDGTDAECARPRGWVLDLAEVGERVNVEMKLVLGALVFASNTPSREPCTVDGHSWFNQVDFRTAAPIPNSITSQYLSDSLNVGFNVLQLPLRTGEQNPTYTGLFRQKKATNVSKPVTPPEPPTLGNRISWREIAQ